jgi:predicted amidophosphoribosyltransferase
VAVLLDLLAPPLCWACRSPAARDGPLCRVCRSSLRFLGPGPAVVRGLEVWAPVAYDGPGAALVKALKFHGAARLAADMAAIIVANAPAPMLAGHLVPVPLHPARRRARPFNQSALIAAAISERAGLPVADCLIRTGSKQTQVGRARAARLRGAGAIQAAGRPPATALLVDDVVTTGATLAACAAALRAAGTRQVGAIAFARTAGR